MKNTNTRSTFAILHIFASRNNTFIHVTDLTGRETLGRCSAGMHSKTDKDEKSSYSAMLASKQVADLCKVYS